MQISDRPGSVAHAFTATPGGSWSIAEHGQAGRGTRWSVRQRMSPLFYIGSSCRPPGRLDRVEGLGESVPCYVEDLVESLALGRWDGPGVQMRSCDQGLE